MRGIAVDDRVALSLRLLEAGEVGLDGDVRDLCRLQGGCNETAYASAAAQQDGAIECVAHCTHRSLGCGCAGASTGEETLDVRAVLNNHGRQSHGERQGDEHRLANL